MVLAGVVAALGALVGGVFYLMRGGQAPASQAAAPTARPAVSPSTPAPPPGQWKFIQSRADDPVPLTLTELFPAKFSSSGGSGALTIDHLGKKCTGALLGANLQAAVTKGHCTQVLRGTYLSADGRMMATIGVLNLVDVAAANRAGKVPGATQFIDPLPAAKGPTHNIRKGTGIEEPVVKGHYLILIWAELTTLKRPSSTAKVQLEQFAAGLFAGTANVSLSSRMVTGKPASPGSPG